jgi:iron-sulfur cluster repair protein YtfE (RIC family)
VEVLLNTIISAEDASRHLDFAMLKRLIRTLELHTRIEEMYLYPQARQEREASNMVQDFYSQHRELKGLLNRLKAEDGAVELVKVCQQIQLELQRHVHEEEGQLFPLLRSHWDEETLLELGEKMLEMKDREMSGR